jgi:hypothetical protein
MHKIFSNLKGFLNFKFHNYGHSSFYGSNSGSDCVSDYGSGCGDGYYCSYGDSYGCGYVYGWDSGDGKITSNDLNMEESDA